MILVVISQIKFVATFLVPSLYPSIMLMVSFVCASLTSLTRLAVMPAPGTEWPFVLNVLFWLGVISLLLTIWLTIKKIAARNPSLNEVLSGLVSVSTMKEYKEEVRLRCVGLEKQISDARHSFDEALKTDFTANEKRFEVIFRLIAEHDKRNEEFLKANAELQERTRTHVREFDNIKGQIERMLTAKSGRRNP